jgi:NitT/TauT family transport system substrate-binding protein
LIKLGFVGVVVWSLVACAGRVPPTGTSAEAASSGGDQLTKITVPYAVITVSNLPVWAAAESGIFQKHGLDVNLTYVDTAEVASLLSGSAQIAQGGGPEVVSANAGGADVVFIATMAPVYSYVFEVAPSIKTVDDLRGKKVGSGAPGSLTDVATRGLLKTLGLDADKDVTLIALASPQARTPALLNGQIDATLDTPPNSYKEEAQGFHSLYDLAEKRIPTISNGITTRRDWLEANRPVAQRYIDAIMESTQRVKTDKTLAVDTLKKYMKAEDADAAKAAEWATSFLIAEVPTTKPENFADILAALGNQNPNIKNLDMSKYVDNSLVQSAVDRGMNKSSQ